MKEGTKMGCRKSQVSAGSHVSEDSSCPDLPTLTLNIPIAKYITFLSMQNAKQ